ncbi:MAG: TetR family transcriptional regulator C-terminal domain-containing protein [Gemmobacter sp.]|jgi:AcrR family transcriptional regulator|nr:TetR family transcriptional regulator C-terminal domain-containing protein [Gemmobacter sp.]
MALSAEAEKPLRLRGTREDQTAERRRAILDATVSVIGKLGLTGLTMKTVADAAGCSYGVTAFHFQSKDGLLLAALDHMLEDYEALPQPLSQGEETAGDAGARRLRAMIESDFDGNVSSARQVAAWVAFWAETARNPAYRQRCAEVKARYRRSTAEDLAALAAARGITIDADQVSATLNAIVDGYWIANLVNGLTGPEGRTAGIGACLAYLDRLFPGDFPAPAP